MLLDIDHVQIAMPRGQEQAARRFYGGLLGLEEIEKPEHLRARGGLWFRLGDRELHLGVEDDFRPANKAHPAFMVDDYAGLTAKLKAEGYPRLEDDPREGYERCFSNDPFGNRLEFLQKRTAS